MKVSDYVRYIDARKNALLADSPENTAFAFEGFNGSRHSIDVCDDVLYMIDFDMVKLVPKLYEDFVDSFEIPEILPGGKHCMLNAVSHMALLQGNKSTR